MAHDLLFFRGLKNLAKKAMPESELQHAIRDA